MPYAAGVGGPVGGGRLHAEKTSSDRDEYERDYARIIHSTSFRLLQYKTQVFANHQGDFFRTRLTHSLEVAQLSSSLSKALGLRDVLANTLAIAHDLGHAPFGHLGQDVLNNLMRDHGGFEHNWQALRIVDNLERPYLGFDGLNLLFDTREGILKHCSAKNAQTLGLLGERFLSDKNNPDSYKSPSLEAQVTDLADAIAYNHADLEDAVFMNVLSIEQIKEALPLFKEKSEVIEGTYGKLKSGEEVRFAKAVCNLMIKEALNDVLTQTRSNLNEYNPTSISDVRRMPKLARFSDNFLQNYHQPMKKFLKENVYQHEQVEVFRGQQAELLTMLFEMLRANPKKYVEGFDSKSALGLERQVCDYLANLTDRKAIEVFHQLRQNYSFGSANKRKVKM